MKTQNSRAFYQPNWSCRDCGRIYGVWHSTGVYTGPLAHLSTWHEGRCDVCQETKPVTEARDFGYFATYWQPKFAFE